MRDQRDERGITISAALNGTWHMTGLLDTESAAIWNTYLDRTAAPASPDDLRPAAMRRVDAITDAIHLFHRITHTPTTPGTPADLPLQESCNGHPGGKPHKRPPTRQTGEDPTAGTPGDGYAWRKTSPANLMIIASHDLLTGQPGAEPATLGDGMIIPAETARRYACEAALNRVVLADGDQPLQLGRTRRLFARAQVKAMTVRDRTCRWKGCEVPAVRCSPHHWLPWSQGGTTDTINGVMLCPTHHRMCHEDQPRTGAHITDPPEPNLRAA